MSYVHTAITSSQLSERQGSIAALLSWMINVGNSRTASKSRSRRSERTLNAFLTIDSLSGPTSQGFHMAAKKKLIARGVICFPGEHIEQTHMTFIIRKLRR